MFSDPQRGTQFIGNERDVDADNCADGGLGRDLHLGINIHMYW